jgi:putative oxidoreductase
MIQHLLNWRYNKNKLMFKRFLLYANTDAGLLVLRLCVGAFMIVHGWGKLSRYEEMFHDFADPIGMGPEVSYILTVGAEFFCSLLIILGLFTRVALIPAAITMIVAVFVIHAADPWGKKELAAIYLMGYIALFVTGPGRYSLDDYLFNKHPHKIKGLVG